MKKCLYSRVGTNKTDKDKHREEKIEIHGRYFISARKKFARIVSTTNAKLHENVDERFREDVNVLREDVDVML